MTTKDNTRIDEGEWQAQERGMRAALGHDEGRLDTATAHYRIVAGAVASLDRSQPPANFAGDVVRHVARHDAGIERLLLQILFAAFLITLIVVAVQYGGHGWQALHSARYSDVLAWVPTGLGCIALSWLCRRVFEPGGHAPDPSRMA